MSRTLAPLRPSVFQLTLKNLIELHAAYIALFAEGGVFIPTTREFHLNDDIYLLLALPDEARRVPIVCKVGWLTPAGTNGGRTPGIGVHFPATPETVALRMRIEQLLGNMLGSDRPTHTI